MNVGALLRDGFHRALSSLHVTDLPLHFAKAIQAMRAERIALGYAGMLEILLGIAHTDPLHDGSRPQVARGRERNDLRQGEPLETHAKSGSGCLGGEASAPMNSGEAPAPLPKPQTWCLEFNDCVPARSNKGSRPPCCTQAPIHTKLKPRDCDQAEELCPSFFCAQEVHGNV